MHARAVLLKGNIGELLLNKLRTIKRTEKIKKEPQRDSLIVIHSDEMLHLIPR